MILWIDGDSCPKKILEMTLGLAQENDVAVNVVADRSIELSRFQDSEKLRFILVPHGSGKTDTIIFEQSKKNDVLITRDLFLAEKLIGKGVRVLNDRGQIWQANLLKRRIEDAVLMQAMRLGKMIPEQRRIVNKVQAEQFRVSLSRVLREIFSA